MRMDDDPIVALFKLGKREHMTELLREGHVFMNTVSYFAQIEGNSPRSDPDEGLGYCRQAEGTTLHVQNGSQWDMLGTLTGAIRIRDTDSSRANIYCLHARTRSHYGQIIEFDQLGFGRFIRRVPRRERVFPEAEQGGGRNRGRGPS